jgi:hypothetical protein
MRRILCMQSLEAVSLPLRSYRLTFSSLVQVTVPLFLEGPSQRLENPHQALPS